MTLADILVTVGAIDQDLPSEPSDERSARLSTNGHVGPQQGEQRTWSRLGNWRLDPKHRSSSSLVSPSQTPKANPARPTVSTDSLSLWGIAPYDDIAVSLSCHGRPSFRSFPFFSKPESVRLLVWLLSRPGVDTVAGYFPSQDSMPSNQSRPIAPRTLEEVSNASSSFLASALARIASLLWLAPANKIAEPGGLCVGCDSSCIPGLPPPICAGS